MGNRKIYFVGIVVVTLFVFSCSENKKEKPENLLDKKKMEVVLSDCFLAESYISNEFSGQTDSAQKALVQTMYADIFEKHGITKQIFEKSYDYYSAEAKNMDEMFRGVISKLESIQKQKNRKDTIASEEIEPIEGIENLVPVQEIQEIK